MAHDPLHRWASLRQRNCQEAQLTLVECLEAESQAEARAQQAERRIAEETQAASQMNSSDADVESFAAWLPHAKLRSQEAQDALAGAQAETARARASLAACRTALRNLEVRQYRRAAAPQAEDAAAWAGQPEPDAAPAARNGPAGE